MLRVGLAFNLAFEKYMFLIVPVCLVLGFIFSPMLRDLTYLVPLLFAYITFVMALGCDWKQIKLALRMPLPMLTTLILVHIAAPWIAYGLGVELFGAESPYVVGMVLFAVIPLGISSIIWVGMSGGNVPLVLSMIVLDSALSPFVVPFMISFFFGSVIEFNHLAVMKDLLLIIVIPMILGVAVNHLTKGGIRIWSLSLGLPTSKLAFVGVVLINAAVIAPSVTDYKRDMLMIVPAVGGLIILFYAMGLVSSMLFKSKEIMVSLTFSSGMRNNSLGVVIALGYFEPRAAIPVILSILIQQPLATLVNSILNKLESKGWKGITLWTKSA